MAKKVFLSLLFILVGIIMAALSISRPFVFNIQPKTSVPPIDVARLRSHVENLSGPLLPRDGAHYANLKKTADYIQSQFVEHNKDVSLQSFEIQGDPYANVISRFPGVGARIIVGAHYDAFDELPGADDNASGVAGLIELSKLIAENPVKVPVTITAFSLEEPPYFRTDGMGSAVHAKSLKQAGESIGLMICLEMIGYYSDQPGSQEYPFSFLKLLYPNTGNFITVVDSYNFSPVTINFKRAFLENTNLPVQSINAPPALPGIDFSDHAAFWDEGYSAVMITDTAFYRNQAYHTAGDTADRLDYRRMGEVVRGVYAYIAALG